MFPVVVVVVECHQKYNWKCLRHEQQQRNSSNKCLSYENIGRKMAEYKYIVTFKHRLSSLHRNLTLFFLWNSCVCLYVICLWNRCERFFLFNRSCFFSRCYHMTPFSRITLTRFACVFVPESRVCICCAFCIYEIRSNANWKHSVKWKFGMCTES